jgi:radical SAM protein with 4Fe4S-binding SPASM domain
MLPYSKLRDAKRPSFASQLPLPGPWAMFLEMTNRCNFKCKFCPESLDDYTERVGGITALTFTDFKKICDDVLALGRLRVLRFYMLGEPFLHKELPDWVAYAKDHGVAERVEITTNATALTAANADRVLKSGLDYLRISIYAINPERHRSITQSQISPDHIRANIKYLWEARKRSGGSSPFIYVKMINPFDKEEEAAFRESYSDICDEIVVEQPMNWDNQEGNDFLDTAYKDNEEPVDRDGIFKYPKQVCPFPFYTLVVHSSGDVSVCCVDWEKKTVCGNVFKESLHDIWHGERLREFQRMHIERRRNENDACKNCTFLFTSPDNIDEITTIEMLYPAHSKTGGLA